MWQALDNWEKYLHDESPRLPLLVRCALLHYQFETIHPLPRRERAAGTAVHRLVPHGQKPPACPLLYLSGYFDQRKSDYYDRLQSVRERGKITEWLLFFLDGVAVQAADAVNRAEQLSDLREKYRARLRGTSGRAPEVIDLLFASPVLTVRYVQEQLGISQPGATNLLRRLTAHGILREQGSGTGVRHRWFSDEVLGVLDPGRGT